MTTLAAFIPSWRKQIAGEMVSDGSDCNMEQGEGQVGEWGTQAD